MQVAAFSKLEAAQGVQNHLLDRINRGEIPHLAGNVVIHPLEAGSLYRVRIGPLASLSLVQELIQHPSLAPFGPLHSVTE